MQIQGTFLVAGNKRISDTLKLWGPMYSKLSCTLCLDYQFTTLSKALKLCQVADWSWPLRGPASNFKQNFD